MARLHRHAGRQRALAVAALLAVALGACQARPHGGPPGQAGAPEAQARETAAPEASAPQRGESAALPPEPVIDDNPARLIGLDAAGLSGLLGPPELIRREPPAEVWQYRGESCVFDVFLYEEAGRQQVIYVEARDGAARRVGERGCLNELLRARLAKPFG